LLRHPKRTPRGVGWLKPLAAGFLKNAGIMEVVVNAQEILDKCGNDTKLLRELCKLYAEESAKLMQALGEAVAKRDAAAIKRTAHSLRGSTQFFSSGPAVETLKSLEAIAGSGSLDDADQVFSRLVQQMNEVREAAERLPLELDAAATAVESTHT
jgi:HPt (histidine-containing phosphotransfer) domain-containing protein